jgi:hypothetical protein
LTSFVSFPVTTGTIRFRRSILINDAVRADAVKSRVSIVVLISYCCVEEACCEAKESPLDLARVARVINLIFRYMFKIKFCRNYKINKTSQYQAL